jgi:hypothetical protein
MAQPFLVWRIIVAVGDRDTSVSTIGGLLGATFIVYAGIAVSAPPDLCIRFAHATKNAVSSCIATDTRQVNQRLLRALKLSNDNFRPCYSHHCHLPQVIEVAIR